MNLRFIAGAVCFIGAILITALDGKIGFVIINCALGMTNWISMVLEEKL